eukprot:TRINITY_DN2225_c0_g1_i1.p1 TRINITY_DN2225_c0_g1~~TRINITY_DN2225_c0_g1_i1.p1  ORF type:complete len:452 (-),score=-0.64 TRINITY_DN2225_c0_g1_i1:30-1385(-)
MVKAQFSSKAKKHNLGGQHIITFAAMVVGFFLLFQFIVIPFGISTFVVKLFQPSGEMMEKIGFVKFGNNLYASTSKEKEKEIVGNPGEIAKEKINKEYIFDFTFAARNDKQHGYVKAAGEFYAKSPSLGESAIILEPWVAFWLLAMVFAIVFAGIITALMPSNIGFLALLFDRQVDHTKVKLRLQTGFSDDIIELLIMPDDKLKDKEINEVRSAFRLIWDRTITEDIASPFQSSRFEDVFDEDTDVLTFRNEALYTRIKEFFSDFVLKEIIDTKNGLLWRRSHSHFFHGLRLYMSHHFTEKYANFTTGLAYGGAAVLIVAVGVRGLKFIPPTRPSVILLAIILEFTMLSLLAFTLIYTEEEERMDKMLKKMEDANRSQLEALRGQQADIHQLSNALVGQTAEIIRNRVEKAIEEFITSGDNIQKVVAEQIARNIMIGLRDKDEDRNDSKRR